MRHHHTLGRAGGTGGVHHVGRSRGGHADRRRRCHVVAVEVVKITDRQARHLRRRQRAVGVVDQYSGLRIGDQREQAFCGVRLVQRHIGRSALEHGELRDDQVDRAW